MWIECKDGDEHVARLTKAVSDGLAATLAEQGRATLAVSGRRSPVPLFHALAEADLDWSRVTVTLVDERFVPADHADSNERLVREHLMVGRARAATFVGLVADPEDLAASVAAANRAYRPIDVAVLGMGEDGHTASLFPDAPEFSAGLAPANPAAYLSVTPPAAPHARVSLTLAALLSAKRLILAIAGEPKRRVYDAASANLTTALPISALIHQTKVPFDAYWTR
ncbi:6-phosphogluconolactonase [Crenobacter cavernae]|uniref:6-phosphogluconolactonase n=1 Tax=Crenobacter cavernae TaxID=2290923 RepID=A0A345Y8A6_9NEIS|nr:6-phosphogluconolactonase [Crenobacter cavernae]AXK40158.1 6-phosphogluconolactonase [Crenobacter cavernae]